MISIEQLDQMFEDGAYQDLFLSEYEFMRVQIQELKPKRITVIGGHTNLDLFYATQGMALDIVNHDPGPGKMAERGHRNIFKKYKRVFDHKGQYTWLDHSVGDMAQLGDIGQLLVISAAHHLVVEPSFRIPDGVDSVAMYHYGQKTFFNAVDVLHHHIPLRIYGPRLAWFDRREGKDFEDASYSIIDKSYSSSITNTMELLK
jgi:hypothetical protein